MKLLKGEFLVFFDARHMKGKKRQKLEDELEKLLKSFGYERWSSGMDLVSRVRDLTFEKKKKGV